MRVHPFVVEIERLAQGQETGIFVLVVNPYGGDIRCCGEKRKDGPTPEAPRLGQQACQGGASSPP